MSKRMRTDVVLLLLCLVTGCGGDDGSDANGGTGGMVGAGGGDGGSDATTCPQPTSGTAQVVDCTGATIAQAVVAQGFSFSPSVVQAKVNDVLEFQLAQLELAHTATAGPEGCVGEWDLRGPSRCLEVLQAGSYPFHCEFHANMTGTLVVSE